MTLPLRFRLVHDDDATVATGVAFGHPATHVVISWIDGRSVELFENIDTFQRAHRPEGRSIEWIDAPRPPDSPDPDPADPSP